MPIISTFMYCEEAKPIGDKLQINNPLNIFRPPFVPSTFSFSIVFGILGLDITEDLSLVRLIFKKQDEVVIDTGNLEIKQEKDPNLTVLPMEARGLMANLDFRNVILRSEGMYETDIYLNGEKIGNYPIYVKGGEL